MKIFKTIKTIASIFILSGTFILSGCSDSVLDRPQLKDADDDTYWVQEDNLRLYANEFYTQFFVGYNTSFTVDYTPVRGFYFNDDVVSTNVQPLFETSIPDVRGANVNTNSSSTPSWLAQYNGPSWYFGWIRKSNIMLNRMETRMTDILTPEAYNHWTAVARFFKALDYCRLVSVFGDVPYFEKEFSTTDNDVMYKDRTPRNELMDVIYDEFKYVLANIRKDDGTQNLNLYVAAGFVSRWMLFEGTWQKYHKNDETRAKKFLDFSVEASEIVMNSGKYLIQTDLRTLFGSEDLASNKECILYRHYDSGQSVTHSIASYNNITEGQGYAANLNLVKSFICKDGNVWQNSTADAKNFDLANLVKTRDPRFEASFWDKPRTQASSLLYTTKFIDRVGPTYAGKTYPSKYGSNTNTNDAPVMRLGEVLLNWIEAKAELATLGGTAVTQADIDKSINVLRDRPLAPEAIAKGVVKTPHLSLASLPSDPSRDSDVQPLIWEIRRERRMELYSEHSRLLDIKRWKKLNYMKGSANPDILKGIWVNLAVDLPTLVDPKTKIGKTQVMKEDGTIVVFNGTNAADMVGYYLPEGVKDRDDFTDRVYLAPVGSSEITLYSQNGYVLTQTPGWE